jgi:hypothetical protein
MRQADAAQEDEMNEVTEVRRFRASLIGNADDSSGWRYRKAREFPWDARNVESAKSLRRLCRALSELSPEDDLWSRYAAVWGEARGDDCLRFVEIEHEMLHAYGFSYRGASGSAEQFLYELVNALELESPADARSPARMN